MRGRTGLGKSYCLRDDILFRRGKGRHCKERLVIPRAVIPEVLKSGHDGVWHPGMDKTLALLSGRYLDRNEADRFVLHREL